jgi:hypothetical protein
MKVNQDPKYHIPAIILSAAFAAIIAITAANLAGFQIVGRTVPFAYPWRLTEPTIAARLTAWGGYLLHNTLAWTVIYLAKRQKPKYGGNLRWFNMAMLAVNAAFVVLHIVQTQLFYDGLAQSVPELTALGSVALMLIVILILETPRRGLIFGRKVKFPQRFMQIIRQYHGYLFSWAAIYTFWYHPTEATWGHLMGFFYIFLLFTQSVLVFNRAHLNRYWTFLLEAFVLVHGVTVAVLQRNDMWPMFAFGFGAMIVLTQMYGLGLNTWARRGLAVAFLLGVVASYGLTGRFAQINEVIRIPVLDYLVVFLLYGMYLAGNAIYGAFHREPALLAEHGKRTAHSTSAHSRNA